MTLVKTYSVFCNIRGLQCHFWVAETTEGAKAARKVAKAAGWKRIDGEDVCPNCQTAIKEET